MSTYFKNLEILCRRDNIDLSVLASEIGIDYSDIRKPRPEDLVAIAQFFKISVDNLLSTSLLPLQEIRSKKIRFFAMDIDGVLTDGGLYYSEAGDESKKFNVKDGMGIKRLQEKGVKCGFLSNGVAVNLVSKRASVLKIDFVEVGQNNKLDVLQSWCAQLGIELNDVAYIGDDVNDIEVLKAVGLAFCPANAHDSVKQVVDCILKNNGGDACVRELIDNYLI